LIDTQGFGEDIKKQMAEENKDDDDYEMTLINKVSKMCDIVIYLVEYGHFVHAHEKAKLVKIFANQQIRSLLEKNKFFILCTKYDNNTDNEFTIENLRDYLYNNIKSISGNLLDQNTLSYSLRYVSAYPSLLYKMLYSTNAEEAAEGLDLMVNYKLRGDKNPVEIEEMKKKN